MGSLFASADAKAVRVMLDSEHPSLQASVADTRSDDTRVKMVTVKIIGDSAVEPYKTLSDYEADVLSSDIYCAALKVSSRPVYVGISAVGGTHYEKSHDLILSRLAEREGEREAILREREEKENPLERLIAAEISFWNRDEASVTYMHYPDETQQTDEQQLENCSRMVSHYYAKLMYNFGDNPLAASLREYAEWSARTIFDAIRDDSRQTFRETWAVKLTPDDMSLVPMRDEAPERVYTVQLVRRRAADGGYNYAVRLEYPEGEEPYYAPRSFALLTDSILSPGPEWWVPAVIATTLLKMTKRHESGPGTWNTLDALLTVPNEEVEAALRATKVD